jgi:hypothetical protein
MDVPLSVEGIYTYYTCVLMLYSTLSTLAKYIGCEAYFFWFFCVLFIFVFVMCLVCLMLPVSRLSILCVVLCLFLSSSCVSCALCCQCLDCPFSVLCCVVFIFVFVLCLVCLMLPVSRLSIICVVLCCTHETQDEDKNKNNTTQRMNNLDTGNIRHTRHRTKTRIKTTQHNTENGQSRHW